MDVMMLDYGPTYLRLLHLPLPDLFDNQYKFVFGKGKIYKPGSDVCIFAVGTVMHTALDAAEVLEREGVSTMVVNMSSISPVDKDLIVECAKAVQHVVTVEDHQIVGGLGSAVCEALAEHYPAKVLRLGMDGFAESGKVDDLYRKYKLDGVGIVEQIEEWIKG
jgi:transketolase